VVVVYLITSNRGFLLSHRRLITKSALAVTGVVAIVLGVYAVTEFLSGALDAQMDRFVRLFGTGSMG